VKVSEAAATINRLRLEILKYRTHFQDPVTGLPTLPMVLETVRKLLDGRERISVFLLSFEREQNLEERLGWGQYDGLLRLVTEKLGAMIRNGEEELSILCQEAVFSETFLLFSANPKKTLEINAFVERGLDVGWEIGGGHGVLRLRSGRGAVIREPKQRIERSIYFGIQQARRDYDRKGEMLDEARKTETSELLRSRRIRTLFQPIRFLKTREIAGFEALSRGPSGGYFELAENLFGFAERAGLLGEIELLCLERALENCVDIDPEKMLFLNLSNSGLEYVEAEGNGLIQVIEEYGVDPARVVLEITERTFADNPSVLQKRVERFRGAGIRIAIDDMGAGYSSLNIVAELRPDFIKLDQLLVRDLPASPIKQNLVSAVLGFANDTGSRVIAEGVEDESEARVLEDLGIDLVQGYHFGRPHPSGEYATGTA